MRYTVVLRGARGSSGPLPRALIKVEKQGGAVPRPQNLRKGEGGPRWEARHSCGLSLSLCGAHDPRRATLVTSPAAAHTLTSSLLSGGGGVEGPFNMVREQFSELRRHPRACLGANTLSLRGGGAGRDRPTWSKEQPSGPRCHPCGHLGAGTLVPCLRDINNKVASPLSLLRHKSGPSSEVAFHL